MLISIEIVAILRKSKWAFVFVIIIIIITILHVMREENVRRSLGLCLFIYYSLSETTSSCNLISKFFFFHIKKLLTRCGHFSRSLTSREMLWYRNWDKIYQQLTFLDRVLKCLLIIFHQASIFTSISLSSFKEI